MIMNRLAIAVLLLLAACAPSKDKATVAQPAEKWPPKDYHAFAARPPMSVGAELQDPWTLAIDAERWSYRMGRAIEILGQTPPPELTPTPDDLLARAHTGQRSAAIRLVRLQQLACSKGVAKPVDCTAFSPPPWVTGATAPTPVPSNDELMERNIWFSSNAEPFILPVCARAPHNPGGADPCAVE